MASTSTSTSTSSSPSPSLPPSLQPSLPPSPPLTSSSSLPLPQSSVQCTAIEDTRVKKKRKRKYVDTTKWSGITDISELKEECKLQWLDKDVIVAIMTDLSIPITRCIPTDITNGSVYLYDKSVVAFNIRNDGFDWKLKKMKRVHTDKTVKYSNNVRVSHASIYISDAMKLTQSLVTTTDGTFHRKMWMLYKDNVKLDYTLVQYKSSNLPKVSTIKVDDTDININEYLNKTRKYAAVGANDYNVVYIFDNISRKGVNERKRKMKYLDAVPIVLTHPVDEMVESCVEQMYGSINNCFKTPGKCDFIPLYCTM